MKDFQGKISVIMPAHNEGANIYSNLMETYGVFKKAECDFEIILVNDGSKDNTLIEASKAADKYKNVIVENFVFNQGKGNAIKNGFSRASGDVVVFLDADLDLHPKQLATLFGIMREQDADVVIGSKRHPESKLNYPKRRKMISKIYCWTLWLLFRLPLHDTQTGLKIYKYEVLEKVFPKILCKRYAFDVEILANAHHLGYKIVESPVVLEFRRKRRWGAITFKDLWHTGLDTLAIFYRMYILKYYDKIQN